MFQYFDCSKSPYIAWVWPHWLLATYAAYEKGVWDLRYWPFYNTFGLTTIPEWFLLKYMVVLSLCPVLRG